MLKASRMFYLSLTRRRRISNGPNKGLIGPLLGPVIGCRAFRFKITITLTVTIHRWA